MQEGERKDQEFQDGRSWKGGPGSVGGRARDDCAGCAGLGPLGANARARWAPAQIAQRGETTEATACTERNLRQEEGNLWACHT